MDRFENNRSTCHNERDLREHYKTAVGLMALDDAARFTENREKQGKSNKPFYIASGVVCLVLVIIICIILIGLWIAHKRKK